MVKYLGSDVANHREYVCTACQHEFTYRAEVPPEVKHLLELDSDPNFCPQCGLPAED